MGLCCHTPCLPFDACQKPDQASIQSHATSVAPGCFPAFLFMRTLCIAIRHFTATCLMFICGAGVPGRKGNPDSQNFSTEIFKKVRKSGHKSHRNNPHIRQSRLIKQHRQPDFERHIPSGQQESGFFRLQRAGADRMYFPCPASRQQEGFTFFIQQIILYHSGRPGSKNGKTRTYHGAGFPDKYVTRGF